MSQNSTLFFIAVQSLIFCDKSHSATIRDHTHLAPFDMAVDISLLDQFSFLKDLPLEVKQSVASHAQAKRYPSQHLVMSHHTTPAFWVLVLRGQLQMTEVAEDGRITGIGLVNPGQVLDWLSIIDGAPIIHSLNTTQETDLLLVPIALARDLLVRERSLASHVLAQLAKDVRRVTEQRQILTLPNAYQRVFVQIIQLAEQSSGHNIANLPKQHEIAAMVNTSRETVSRAIQMLIKNGILVKNGHRFVIQGTDQLRRLAAMGNAVNKAEKS